jgi:hypothetical protein
VNITTNSIILICACLHWFFSNEDGYESTFDKIKFENVFRSGKYVIFILQSIFCKSWVNSAKWHTNEPNSYHNKRDPEIVQVWDRMVEGWLIKINCPTYTNKMHLLYGS